jgi:hypothetical protein
MSTLSRRGFVTRVSGVLLMPVWGGRALGQSVDPRVAKVVTSTLAIDMHNHVYPAGTQQGGRGGDPGPALSFADELKLSGLTAIGAGFALDRAGNVKPGELHPQGVTTARPSTGVFAIPLSSPRVLETFWTRSRSRAG